MRIKVPIKIKIHAAIQSIVRGGIFFESQLPPIAPMTANKESANQDPKSVPIIEEDVAASRIVITCVLSPSSIEIMEINPIKKEFLTLKEFARSWLSISCVRPLFLSKITWITP